MYTLMTKPTKPTATDHMDLKSMNLNEEAFIVGKKGSYVIISKEKERLLITAVSTNSIFQMASEGQAYICIESYWHYLVIKSLYDLM